MILQRVVSECRQYAVVASSTYQARSVQHAESREILVTRPTDYSSYLRDYIRSKSSTALLPLILQVHMTYSRRNAGGLDSASIGHRPSPSAAPQAAWSVYELRGTVVHSIDIVQSIPQRDDKLRSSASKHAASADT